MDVVSNVGRAHDAESAPVKGMGTPRSMWRCYWRLLSRGRGAHGRYKRPFVNFGGAEDQGSRFFDETLAPQGFLYRSGNCFLRSVIFGRSLNRT